MIDLIFLVPETYTKALLERKARRLRKETGNDKFHSQSEIDKPTMYQLYRVSLLRHCLLFHHANYRPWRMFLEPIVLLFSIYVALLYGILYLLFVAFPIIFEGTITPRNRWDCRAKRLGCRRKWSRFPRYRSGKPHRRLHDTYSQQELPLPDGKTRRRQTHLARSSSPSHFHWGILNANKPFLVLTRQVLPNNRFAWTSFPTLHWIGFILAGVPFGLAQILLFLSIMNYLADCYLQYAASALAANSLLRSVLGATFPLWSP